MSAPHQAILDALCRRAQYDPSTVLARLPGPGGEPVTVARMAGALAAGEPWAREWAEDVTGAAVRMVVGRGPSEPVDLDAWRAEAGAVVARADTHRDEPWYWNEIQRLVYANGVDVATPEVRAFIAAARTGWPRDAARVGALCERVALLERLLAEALDGWYAAHFPGSPRRADAENIARLRAIAAGGAPAPTRAADAGEPCPGSRGW